MQNGGFHYVGGELDLFAEAGNWRAYWTGMVQPFVGSAVLEVGAGIGSATRALWAPGRGSWLALEPDRTLFARLSETVASGGLAGVEPRCATSAELDGRETFDTALYIDVMEHIEDDVAEMARLVPHLRQGAHVIVLAPAHRFLFTPFDAAIGHVRRYDSDSMARLTLPGLRPVCLRYLDSVGMLASLGNRLLLRADRPTRGQIALWNGWMVPASRRLDALLGFRIGKSILGVWRRVKEGA
ncbi:class I SAM-dependent methyltransferase [Falsiroseomonas sp. HW251]|uniref:class I SAM-dependent methyltransferase n=1 Tax=Falsiroseomonas sp. HW251 TaxID=3390998 RepID=UPI003D32093E